MNGWVPDAERFFVVQEYLVKVLFPRKETPMMCCLLTPELNS